MKTWAVVSARSSGLLATRKKLAGPLLKIDPCAVTSSSTIRFTGMLAAKRLAEPEVERQHPLGTQLLGVDAEQVAPLQRPEIDILRAIEQAVDQLGPLVGIVVGQKVLDLVGRRGGADRVEHRAAEELGVGAQRRGSQPELAPLGRRPWRR